MIPLATQGKQRCCFFINNRFEWPKNDIFNRMTQNSKEQKSRRDVKWFVTCHVLHAEELDSHARSKTNGNTMPEETIQ